ncbi:hypothetical protein SUGI_0838990 [Cryptomeria japonica]|uniref:lipase-like PAD4 n=1 Tax=Cryptomeria japonica TaxID=3369 RepID=UPI002414BAAF|nr:lipase-like PAD4 [Cryptomeria japonica]GLJ40641.1 hypothetical protein SUGI_0838990 [Cryptomeria japonica]
MRGVSGLPDIDRFLPTCWEVCQEAYKYGNGPFTCKRKDDFVFISFPGCNNVEEISAENKFGECKIDEGNQLFRSLRAIALDEPALVHKPTLERFLFLLQNTEFEKKVQGGKYRRIVLTGHSFGGSVAVLATLWLLEQRGYSSNQPPICVTFGSPLVGDEIFAQSVRREKWASYFYHFISRYDIVPRILLAPLRLISEPLRALLPYWANSIRNTNVVSAPLLSEPGNFLRIVMQNTASVASYRSAMCMAPNNMLLSGISSVVRQSPYRAFGSYIFLSRSGFLCTDNYEAVLQILFYSLQSPDEYRTPEPCIFEHIQYGSVLEGVLNSMDVDIHDNLATQFEAVGLGTQSLEVQLALKAAEEVMRRLNTNKLKKEQDLGNMRTVMEELESYKKTSKAMATGDYDCFKRHAEKRDFLANLARLRLAGFWDEIKDMLHRKELPDDFESQEEWIKAGTSYRRMVEPLDIANYYRLGKHEDTGHYLAKGRPRRYLLLQKWLEAAELRRSTQINNLSTPDSCLWAHFEQISYTLAKAMPNLAEGQELPSELKTSLQNFQSMLKTLIDRKQVCEDFFIEEGSFVKWWKGLPVTIKSVSPLWDFMEGRGRHTYTPDFKNEGM